MDRRTGECFAMDRFNRLDWPIQKERILAFARQHRGRHASYQSPNKISHGRLVMRRR